MKVQSTQGLPRVNRKPKIHGSRLHSELALASVSTHGGPRLVYYTAQAVVSTATTQSRRTRKAGKYVGMPVYASVALVLVSFVFGVWFTWSTHSSQADTAVEEGVGSSTAAGAIPIQSSTPLLTESDKISDQNVLTMTMEQLENYLQVATTTPEKQAAETMRLRTTQLKTYLESKGSPLALFAETIAGLKHWRLVLAISNSESSLGRRCADNNCSGIGVMPGHPLWRTYETKAEWAKDLDRLIEKRYKNWSLEKMNGVYNQPGSENWVYAARQILSDIQSIP